LNKYYVLDTNVLLHSPQSIFTFHEKGNLLEDVPLNDTGGILQLETNCQDVSLPPHWDHGKADNRILQIYKGLVEKRPTVLVSRDTTMPVKTNQFILIRSTDNDRHTSLGRFDGEKVIHLKYHSRKPFGVSPRNIGQVFLQKYLMLSAEEAPLVFIKGLCSLTTASIKNLINMHLYQKRGILRKHTTFKDLGSKLAA